MRTWTFRVATAALTALTYATGQADQHPLLNHEPLDRNITLTHFAELEELSRIVDIAYCVGLTSAGISKPFECLSRCSEFPSFELITTWNTGPLLSDSCGYIALDHDQSRVIVAFRGTYSIANTIVDLSTIPQRYEPYPGLEPNSTVPTSASTSSLTALPTTAPSAPKCNNCTVHTGFHTSWLNTRARIINELAIARHTHPSYRLHLVGHSLGGAVAALAGLETLARGWDPIVTTYGEPRVGNAGFVKYIDERFGLSSIKDDPRNAAGRMRYRRVTHVDDPVPLLPLTEWGYAMHAGEIFIAKPALSPELTDVRLCEGDNDAQCIAGQDASVFAATSGMNRKRDLIGSVREEIHDVMHEPWGIPSRYKLWQLFFAHRDYFWRLGLCVPGGDPLGGGGKYDPPKEAL